MSEMIDFSSALQRAFDLGDKAATAQYEAQNRPNIIEHDGAAYLYFNGKLTQIEPAEIYHPETFYLPYKTTALPRFLGRHGIQQRIQVLVCDEQQQIGRFPHMLHMQASVRVSLPQNRFQVIRAHLTDLAV